MEANEAAQELSAMAASPVPIGSTMDSSILGNQALLSQWARVTRAPGLNMVTMLTEPHKWEKLKAVCQEEQVPCSLRWDQDKWWFSDDKEIIQRESGEWHSIGDWFKKDLTLYRTLLQMVKDSGVPVDSIRINAEIFKAVDYRKEMSMRQNLLVSLAQSILGVTRVVFYDDYAHKYDPERVVNWNVAQDVKRWACSVSLYNLEDFEGMCFRFAETGTFSDKLGLDVLPVPWVLFNPGDRDGALKLGKIFSLWKPPLINIHKAGQGPEFWESFLVFVRELSK